METPPSADIRETCDEGALDFHSNLSGRHDERVPRKCPLGIHHGGAMYGCRCSVSLSDEVFDQPLTNKRGMVHTVIFSFWPKITDHKKPAKAKYPYIFAARCEQGFYRVSENYCNESNKNLTCSSTAMYISIDHAPTNVFKTVRSSARRSQRNGALQPKVPTARTNRERDRAVRLGPSLTNNVPNRQVIPRKRDRRLGCLARLEDNVCEAFQDRGWFVRRCGVVHVELGDLKGWCGSSSGMRPAETKDDRLTSPP